MDIITHSVSGAAFMLAMPHRPNTIWAVPLSMAIATLPDIDVIFNRVPIDNLLLHRGITHALPALPVFAPLCALLMFPLWKHGVPGAWTFRQTTLFAFLLLLMHIWLDCVTNYGTLAFLPFSNHRVRLNGLFIVDLLLLIPLIVACCAASHRPRIAALAMIWLLLYSGGAVAWRMYLQHKWNTLLQADGIAPTQLNVLPDVFSPLFWKVQYKHADQCFQAPLAWNGLRTGPWQQGQSADPLLSRLVSEDRSARIWTCFSLMPVQKEQNWEGGKEYSFHDWRFGSLVPFLQNAMSSHIDATFSFMVRFDEADKLIAVRFNGSPGGRGPGWQPPVMPKGRSGINWLIGLDD